MTLKNVLTTLVITVILVCCKKEDDESIFAGITERSSYGDLMGSIDTKDWRLDDKWSSKEENLFPVREINALKSPSSFQVKNAAVPEPETKPEMMAYPNPCVDAIILNLNGLDFIYFDVRIVDQNFRVIRELDKIEGGVMAAFEPQLERSKIYRAYYKVYSKGKTYRGHGDIKLR